MGQINIPSTPFQLPTTQQLPPTPPTSATGTTYTWQLSDAQGWKRFTNASGCLATILQNVFPVGTLLTGEAATAGLVQVTAGAGVTILPASPITFLTQSAVVGFFQAAANVWVAYGEKA